MWKLSYLSKVANGLISREGYRTQNNGDVNRAAPNRCAAMENRVNNTTVCDTETRESTVVEKEIVPDQIIRIDAKRSIDSPTNEIGRSRFERRVIDPRANSHRRPPTEHFLVGKDKLESS